MTDSWQRDEFTITTDPSRLDIDVIHEFLAHSYWASGIPRDVVERSIANALCFGVFAGRGQVGFARVVTDYATFAYVGDVFVLEPWRGRGLSKWLMRTILEHPRLQGLRRWSLLTRDAHGLYAQVGFTPLADPSRWMEKRDPDVYRRATA